MYEEEVDLQELWQALMKRKWLIIGITVVAMVVAYVASCMMTPIYEAEATFLIQGGAQALRCPSAFWGCNRIGERLRLLTTRRYSTAALSGSPWRSLGSNQG